MRTSPLQDQIQAALQRAPIEALPLAQQAAEIAQREGDARQEAEAWRIVAQSLRALGRQEEALAAFDSATEAARRAQDALLEAQVQVGRIAALGWLGRQEEAVALGERLVALFRQENAGSDAAKVLVNLGILHFRRDQYLAALACYDEALTQFEAENDAASAARTRLNRANALTPLGRIEEAMQDYEAARAVFAAANQTAYLANLDGNLGYLHYVSGQFTQAMAFQTRSRQASARLGSEEAVAHCDTDLADIYRALNLAPEALECYERAIQTYQRLGMDYDRARAEVGRADAMLASGRYDEALAALGRAERIFLAQKNRVQLAYLYLMQTHLLQRMGLVGATLRSAQQSARHFQRERLPGWAAEARFYDAEIRLEETLRPMHRTAQTARRYGRDGLECRAEFALGRAFAQRGETSKALRHLRRSVVALERSRSRIAPEEMHIAYLRDKLTVYEELVRILLERGRPRDVREALECVERSKSRLLLERLQSSLEARSDRESEPISEARQTLATLRAELSRAYFRDQRLEEPNAERRVGSPLAVSSESRTALERQYREAVRQVESEERERVAGIFALTATYSAERLQQALAPDEALIEFYTLGDQVCAFLLTPNSVQALRNVASLEAVNFAARRLRYQTQKAGMLPDYAQRYAEGLHREIRQTLCELYALLLEPLANHLPQEKVALIPHGALHGLPFHAFLSAEGFALERWEFLYAPSAAVWYATRQRRSMPETQPASDAETLLMGVPSPGIAQVAEEIRALAERFPQATVFCGEAATLAAFHAHAEGCRYLHLAMHGQFRTDNPLFSGLQFADGRLLARDLYERRLNCDLVTLSACRTGVAFVEAGDELFGLLRGFLSAGARALNVSLWSVDDAATAALMVLFYDELRQGKSKAAALRAAQRALMPQYAHPYYWGAFALIGER